MKKNPMKHFLIQSACVLLLCCSCTKTVHKEGTYESTSVKMGNGFLKSWVMVDNFAKPKSIGFTMSAGALENLPDTSGGHHYSEYEVPVPNEGFRTPFSHIVINWNPVGHVPLQIYDKPHFDFHFYMTSREERKKIPVYPKDTTKFQNAPPAAYLPLNYFYPGGGEPEMGAHWVDLSSNEFKPGGTFTETFIYGTYDGQVTFLEPMITLDFLKSISDFTRDIPRPDKVQQTGYYPRKMHIVKTGDEYTFSLESLEYRTKQ
jgi:hypothetical protein